MRKMRFAVLVLCIVVSVLGPMSGAYAEEKARILAVMLPL